MSHVSIDHYFQSVEVRCNECNSTNLRKLRAATQLSYADFVSSAGLFNALTGEVMGYEDGRVMQAGVSPTGALADLSGTSNYLWIGTTYLAQAGNLNVCNGTFASARCLNQVTENDAIQLSNRT